MQGRGCIEAGSRTACFTKHLIGNAPFVLLFRDNESQEKAVEASNLAELFYALFFNRQHSFVAERLTVKVAWADINFESAGLITKPTAQRSLSTWRVVYRGGRLRRRCSSLLVTRFRMDCWIYWREVHVTFLEAENIKPGGTMRAERVIFSRRQRVNQVGISLDIARNAQFIFVLSSSSDMVRLIG